MNHKRKRPKHLRAGCLRCKAWKDERAAKGDRIKASLQRRLQRESRLQSLGYEDPSGDQTERNRQALMLGWEAR